MIRHTCPMPFSCLYSSELVHFYWNNHIIFSVSANKVMLGLCVKVSAIANQTTSSMMTSSNGTISALLAICAGNSPVTGEFLAQRPVTRSFDVFSDLHLNKRLSKQSWGRWLETPSLSLWRHCNGPEPCTYTCHMMSSSISMAFESRLLSR